jgi:hypothetical protein
MNEPLTIPADLEGPFRRLMNRVAPEVRNDPEMQKAVLVYLKLGGEPLARHCIEIGKKKFPDQTIILKKHFREENPDLEEGDEDGSDEEKDISEEDSREDGEEYEAGFEEDLEDAPEI